MSRYRCVHCGRILERDSTKAWVKSVCVATPSNLVQAGQRAMREAEKGSE